MRIDPDAIQSSRPVDRDIQLLADEVRRLRSIIANSDPALTAAEREAVEWALREAVWSYSEDNGNHRDTLRDLLERLSPSATSCRDVGQK